MKLYSKYAFALLTLSDQGAYFNDYCNWQTIQQFKDFAFNSPAAEIAAKLMNSQYSVFYHEHVLNKEPGMCIVYIVFMELNVTAYLILCGI